MSWRFQTGRTRQSLGVAGAESEVFYGNGACQQSVHRHAHQHGRTDVVPKDQEQGASPGSTHALPGGDQSTNQLYIVVFLAH